MLRTYQVNEYLDRTQPVNALLWLGAQRIRKCVQLAFSVLKLLVRSTRIPTIEVLLNPLIKPPSHYPSTKRSSTCGRQNDQPPWKDALLSLPL